MFNLGISKFLRTTSSIPGAGPLVLESKIFVLRTYVTTNPVHGSLCRLGTIVPVSSLSGESGPTTIFRSDGSSNIRVRNPSGPLRTLCPNRTNIVSTHLPRLINRIVSEGRPTTKNRSKRGHPENPFISL